MPTGDMNSLRRKGLCTAPKQGHKSPVQAALCPVHKAHGMEHVKSMPTSAIVGMSTAEQVSAAKVEGLPRAMLGYLAKVPDRNVRGNIASNPSTPHSTLLEMLEADPDIGSAMTGRSDLDDTLVEAIRATPNGESWLARGSGTPAHVLEDLALHCEDETYRMWALTNAALPSEAVTRIYRATMEGRTELEPEETARDILFRQSAPAEVLFDITLRFYAESERVARHKSAPKAALEILAQRPDPTVHVHVVNNKRSGPEALEHLLDDPDPAVRRAARERFAAAIGKRFGVSPNNQDAIDMIRRMDWRNLKRSSPDIALVHAMHPDA